MELPAAKSVQATRKSEKATEQLNFETLTSILVATNHYQNLEFYEAVVIIRQYFSFFGHNQYEDAYSLVSQKKPNLESLEEFIQDRKN